MTAPPDQTKAKPATSPDGEERGLSVVHTLTPKQRRRALLLSFVCFSIGIPGLILPFLQGVLFLLIGVLLLSYSSSSVFALVRRLEQRFPRLRRPLAYADKKAKRWL